jgi:diketogulonate reductase-like aldo/keto reductase
MPEEILVPFDNDFVLLITTTEETQIRRNADALRHQLHIKEAEPIREANEEDTSVLEVA